MTSRASRARTLPRPEIIAALSVALLMAGCGGAETETAKGYALAAGYLDVIARMTNGDTKIDEAICGSGYVYAFSAKGAAGLICVNGNATRFIARSDLAVSPVQNGPTPADADTTGRQPSPREEH